MGFFETDGIKKCTEKCAQMHSFLCMRGKGRKTDDRGQISEVRGGRAEDRGLKAGNRKEEIGKRIEERTWERIKE